MRGSVVRGSHRPWKHLGSRLLPAPEHLRALKTEEE